MNTQTLASTLPERPTQRRLFALFGAGLLGLPLWACGVAPPPETVGIGGYGQPMPIQRHEPAPVQPVRVGWTASENDDRLETRYVNGVQVGVVAGPMGGASDCSCASTLAASQIAAPHPTSAMPGEALPEDGPMEALLQGTASWFGEELLDLPTTSGAERSQWGVFASHPTLPYGTEVEVTNLTNQRRTRVVINDRTGVNDRRILMVSEGSATALDMKRGHESVPVRLRVIRAY